jgi:hypothetical protein
MQKVTQSVVFNAVGLSDYSVFLFLLYQPDALSRIEISRKDEQTYKTLLFITKLFL